MMKQTKSLDAHGDWELYNLDEESLFEYKIEWDKLWYHNYSNIYDIITDTEQFNVVFICQFSGLIISLLHTKSSVVRTCSGKARLLRKRNEALLVSLRTKINVVSTATSSEEVKNMHLINKVVAFSWVNQKLRFYPIFADIENNSKPEG